jgi:hypothetical protein
MESQIPVTLPLEEIRMEMESWMPVKMTPSGEATATVVADSIWQMPSLLSTFSLDYQIWSAASIVAM